MSTYNVYVLSDSIGETNEQVVKSILAQFPETNFQTSRFSNILTVQILEDILSELELDNQTIIFFTFVQKDLIKHIEEKAKKYSFKAVNVLGGGMNAVSELIQKEPSQIPGAVRKMDDSYFARVKAIEFAVRYDDGQDASGINKADLVLIGVSRTSKTPLSMYLANKGIKVCNIPLFPENKPPEELYKVSPTKIIGLTNDVKFLNQIRIQRLKSLGLSDSASYADNRRIMEELAYAGDIMKRIGCIVINVQNKAIEETASDILDYLNDIGVKYL